MPTRPSVVPAVPSFLVGVELVAAERAASAGTGRAAVVAAPDGRTWFGPGTDALTAGSWRPVPAPTGAAGELRATGTATGPCWLVGVGARREVDWRTGGGALAREFGVLTDAGAELPATVEFDLPADITAVELGALVLGLRLGGYRFTVSGTQIPAAVRTVRLRVAQPSDELAAAVRRASALAAATGLARDLANMPANVKNPAWLAETSAAVAGALPGLAATVRDERWLAERGFGGVLAVGGGSASPPRLLELAWRPRTAAQRAAAARAPHLVLVGKGITFDTGGISLKPVENMHQMRTDMSGGAAVVAALRAIAELGLPIRVTGLVPMAENHLSGSAYRPGDVVRHYGGTTTEVLNTDAEGRMVLADALAYAVHRHKPDLLVDVATLTGAMKVSLGRRTAGFFASTDELAERISAAGAATGESWWRMPLLAAHAEDVRSRIADVRQRGGDPGAIFAALFLREFTGGLPWAHLDIAGPARADEPYAEVSAGGTGFATRTLTALAESLAHSSSIG
ncbi:MAG TPA: leucyl aminopeptidase [Pseudonocardiaceae bacterium]|jgi:leucyl aminopeptidase|nr:leucyl aminopeptidase [Pseudonocardiaceae bacterium]